MSETDNFEVDLGISLEDAQESLTKGAAKGIGAGLAQGGAEAGKSIGKQAAILAMKQMQEGGKSTAIDDALNNMGKVAQIGMFQKMMDNLTATKSQNVQPANLVSPMTSLQEKLQQVALMIGTFKQMGMDVSSMNPMQMLAMVDPTFAPMAQMMMPQQQGQNHQSGGIDPTTMMMLNMMSKQNQAPQNVPPPVDTTTQFLAMMADMNQRHQEQMMALQMENMKMYQQVAQLANPQQPSFIEQMSDLTSKIQTFKGTGLLGNSEVHNAEEAQVAIESQKLGLQLKQMEMENNRVLAAMERENILAQKKMDMEQNMQNQQMSAISNVVSGIGKLIGPSSGQQIGSTIRNNLNSRISNMLNGNSNDAGAGGVGPNPQGPPN